MIAVPAVDLRAGQAVQLVGGKPGSERVSLPDPVAVAGQWAEAGFTRLHLIDLDAAFGDGDNRLVIERIIAATSLPCQVGGGVRDSAAIEATLAVGADGVIVGTRAVEDPAWLTAVARSYANRLIVAADVRDERVLVRGWTRETTLSVDAFLETLDELPLAGVLVTDVGREGSESGVDSGLFRRLATRTRHPVHAAGGIASLQDLHNLDAAGISCAVLGMALYTGRLDSISTAREYGS